MKVEVLMPPANLSADVEFTATILHKTVAHIVFGSRLSERCAQANV